MTSKNIIKEAILKVATDGHAEIVANAIADYCDANYVRINGDENTSRNENPQDRGMLTTAIGPCRARLANGTKAKKIANAIADYCDANYVRIDGDENTPCNPDAQDRNIIIDAFSPKKTGVAIYTTAIKIGNAIANYCDATYVHKSCTGSSTRITQNPSCSRKRASTKNV